MCWSCVVKQPHKRSENTSVFGCKAVISSDVCCDGEFKTQFLINLNHTFLAVIKVCLKNLSSFLIFWGGQRCVLNGLSLGKLGLLPQLNCCQKKYSAHAEITCKSVLKSHWKWTWLKCVNRYRVSKKSIGTFQRLGLLNSLVFNGFVFLLTVQFYSTVHVLHKKLRLLYKQRARFSTNFHCLFVNGEKGEG